MGSGRIFAAGLFALSIQSAAFMLEKLFFETWAWQTWGLVALAGLCAAGWMGRVPTRDGISAQQLVEDRKDRRQAWLEFFRYHGDGIGVYISAVSAAGILLFVVMVVLPSCFGPLPGR